MDFTEEKTDSINFKFNRQSVRIFSFQKRLSDVYERMPSIIWHHIRCAQSTGYFAYTK